VYYSLITSVALPPPHLSSLGGKRGKGAGVRCHHWNARSGIRSWLIFTFVWFGESVDLGFKTWCVCSLFILWVGRLEVNCIHIIRDRGRQTEFFFPFFSLPLS
jgi:hypothetical protein